MQITPLNKLHKAKITYIKDVTETMFYLKFVPTDKVESVAGQFISILCGDMTLRRPFSIASAQEDELGVLVKKKGKGTEYLSTLRVGEKIDFVGAMGNGYKIEDKKSLLVGAGVGIAPVLYLNEELKKRGIQSLLMAGFQTEKEVPLIFDYDKICTDDGTMGLQGSVLNYVRNSIEEFAPEKIYACGPKVVLENISQISKRYDIPCEVAMEKEMACSIGVCRGCVIRVIKNGIEQNATVCQDGPVFKGEEIAWSKI